MSAIGPNAAAADANREHSAFTGETIRVLRALAVPEGRIAEPNGPTSVVAVLDTETTGLDADRDVIIELAIRRVRIDETGRIVEVGRGQSWLSDPGRPLDADVAKLTGLSDEELRGRVIDTRVATGMIRSADWVCAHNSAFDRRFVERALPDAAGAKWCCSCVDVDWARRGFDGRSLGWLLAQSGLCHVGHRALNDVDAVVALLADDHEGRSAAAEMLANASAPAWLISAVGASFAVKDVLRRRGYRWDADLRLWRREVPDRARLDEEFWLARNIYSDEARPQALGPRFDRIDPTSRFL